MANRKKIPKEFTSTELASNLGCTTQAISTWKKNNKIPAEMCFAIEDIYRVNSRKLWDNPNILFEKLVRKRRTNLTKAH